jgi:hypothetical protein
MPTCALLKPQAFSIAICSRCSAICRLITELVMNAATLRNTKGNATDNPSSTRISSSTRRFDGWSVRP